LLDPDRGRGTPAASRHALYELINEHYTFSRRIIPEDSTVVTLRMPRYLYSAPADRLSRGPVSHRPLAAAR
jgi:hypothetical protein